MSQLLPARVGFDAYLAPALLGLAPAVLFAASASASGLRGTRSDLGGSGAGRVRWIVEALVVGLAATALVLLLRRGLTSSATSVGVDPLLAATPLLLSLAVCTVVLRLYPVPLHWLATRLRRRPGLSGFLGATRAVRDRSLALAAVLALVVGVSVSVFSSVLLTTLDRGVSESAADRVGADLRVEGPVFDTQSVAAAAEIAGVAAVAGIDTTPAALRIDNVLTTLTLFIADTEQLRSVRELPAGLTQPDGDAVPIVVSSDIAEGLDPTAELLLEGKPVSIAGVADRTEGFGSTSTWGIVDMAFAERITGLGFLPRLVLVDVAPGADTRVVASELGELGGPLAVVTSKDDAEAAARAAPTTAGLRIALIVAIVAIAVLAALAIVMSSAIGAGTRNRIIALLRTLGASRRESAALVAWELVPLALVAIVAGTALGLALPWTVLAGVDLRPFTGGDSQPAPAVDPPLVLGVLAAVIVAIILASAAAVVIGRRADPATSLRMGAE